MASTSEVGNAKTIANLNLLNTHIIDLGSIYNPSNRKLAPSNMQTVYTTASHQQTAVNNLLAPYTLAVDNRELIFKTDKTAQSFQSNRRSNTSPTRRLYDYCQKIKRSKEN